MLATRRRHGEYVKMPLDQDQSNAYTCGKYVKGRKTEMIRVFDKVSMHTLFFVLSGVSL